MLSIAKILPAEKMWEIPHTWSQAQLYYAMVALEEIEKKHTDTKSPRDSNSAQGNHYPNLKSENSNGD